MRVTSLLLAAVLAAGILPSHDARAQVAISEILAANVTGIEDVDGARSDWIELRNADLSPVNLAGWTLTDDPANPARWKFPATNLAARGHLVVFASGKDRAVAGAELHTNFRLDAAGGYVGLARPDGKVVSAFRYPPQRDDTSFGTAATSFTNALVAEGAAVRFVVPSEGGAGLSWTGGLEPFADSEWLEGRTGLGYDTNAAGRGPIRETVGEPAIARGVTDTASGSIFVLATAGFTQVGDVTEWLVYSTSTFPITPLVLRLEPNGTYVITGIGTTRTSSGRGAQTNGFGLVAGSARVGPGYFFAWKDGSNGGNSTGVPAWTDGGAAGVRWFQQHTTFSVNENLGAGQFFSRAYSLQARVGGTLLDLARTNVQSLMLGVNPSLYLRAPFNLAAGPGDDDLRLRIHYDDGFVAWLNGVEVARRNSPQTLAFNAAAVTNRATSAAVESEAIDLSAFTGMLRAGPNLLAIQGLNDQVDSGEFLLVPTLTATRSVVASNQFMAMPTPGQPNGGGQDGWVAATRFSPKRGIYWAPTLVTLTNATPGAVIRYTTDGSWPEETNGTIYTDPFLVTNNTVVRAAGFVPGYIAPAIETHTYLFPARVAGQPTNPAGFPSTWSGSAADYEVDPNVTGSTAPGYDLTNALVDLPTVSVSASRPDLFDPAQGIYYNSANAGVSWRRRAAVELIFPDGRDGFDSEVSLRMAGDSSSGHGFTPKHSLRLAFQNALGRGKLRFPLFDDSAVERYDQLELRACSTDSWCVEDGYVDNGLIRWTHSRATYLRDQYMRDTLRDLGQPTSHGRYVHVYLNGLYWGVYNLVEWMNDGWNEEHFGGDKSEYDVLKDYAELEEGNATAWNEMLALVNAGFPNEAAYQRIQGRDPDGRPNPTYPVYVHVGNLIDYMLAHIYGGSEDWPGHNWWASRRRGPASEGFRFYAWDQEISNDSLLRTQVISGFGPARFEAVSYPNCAAIIYDRLRRNPSFQQRFIDRVQEVMIGTGPLTPLACSNRWMTRQREIDRAIVAESARWGDRRREPPYRRDTNWLSEMAWQAGFWASNHVRAIERFRAVGLYPTLGAPIFSQPGGPVPAGFALALANTNGTGAIYLTTDTTDPRLPSGDVAPQARPYVEPLAVNGPQTVRARIRAGTNWSGIVSATFFPPQDLSPLRITEVMYHPPDIGLIDGDDYEFLELKNTGGTALDLSGLTFSAGLSFTFTNATRLAPGEFFVLARDATRFAERYPGVVLGGVYSGNLDNSGERLALAYPGTPGASGGPSAILALTFDDRAPWPVSADGHGFSLVPNENAPGLAPDQAVHWRASTAVGGSPGADDPPSQLPPVRINEVLSHAVLPAVDAVELFNPTGAPVDLSGWSLTDDPDLPRKFPLPPGTILAAEGYRVFTEAAFNPTPGTNQSFAFSPRGETVYLFSADATGTLTGYSHGFAFGAAPAGETFGRYRTSTGEETFPLQDGASLGSANRGPRIGPIVITEIHYHPDLADDEFVEIRNLSGQDVPLFDPGRPDLAWRLNGADFVFPSNSVLAAGSYAVIVAIEPGLFAARHSLSAGTLIFGPFAGDLQNGGERLELQRPILVETNGLAYATVDEVRYRDETPWPVGADGSGPSLQKHAAAAYGNDPVNWEAAQPTPGRGRPSGIAPVIVTSPADQTVVSGQPATFRVTADGSGALRYQWRFNGRPIDGATNDTLGLPAATPTQAGAYDVVVFNEVGSADSLRALLTVLRPASIVGQPGSVLLRGSTNAADYGSTTNRSATFNVQAFSSSPLAFQWRFNGQPIPPAANPSAQSPTLTVPNVTFAQDGNYDVLVRDAVGEVASDPGRLTVLLTPQFTLPPVNVEVVAGGSFTVGASIRGNPPPFAYQWRQGSTPLLPFELRDETNAFFTRTNVQVNHAGTYRLLVTNLATGVTAPNVTFTVTVLPDTDGDGLPDAWESAYFGTPTGADRQADSDGDGVSNGDEYTAGTEATNALSYLKVDAIAAAPNAAASVRFGAVARRTYTLEAADAAAGGSWRRQADLPARATNWTATIVDSGASPSRFYRVRTPRAL